MKKFLISACLVLFSSSMVFAQDGDEGFSETAQIGLTASSVAGAGIHYIFPIDPKNSFKLTGIYVYNDRDGDKDSFFSLGGEFQYDLRETDVNRVYAFVGGHIDNRFSEETFFNNRSNSSQFLSLGGGIGTDLGDSKRGLVFNVHISYQFTRGFGDESQTRLGLGAGVGFGYNF